MAEIHCKACGKTYRYEKEGFCPECGAYNRPPKRERVNADGSVQHMSQAAYERRGEATGKVCFEEKECHEEKVCYEDQARSRRDDRQVQHLPQTTQTALPRSRTAGGKNGRRGLAFALGIVALVTAANTSLFAFLRNTFGGARSEPLPAPAYTDYAPEEEALPGSGEEIYEVALDEWFTLPGGGRMRATGWTYDEMEETITVKIETDGYLADWDAYLYCPGRDDYCELYLWDVETGPGGEVEALVFSAEECEWPEPFGMALIAWDGNLDSEAWWIEFQ